MHIKLKICLNPAFKLGKPKFCGAEIDYYSNKKENRIEITAYEIKGKIQLSDCIQLISKYKTLSEAKVWILKSTLNKIVYTPTKADNNQDNFTGYLNKFSYE